MKQKRANNDQEEVLKKLAQLREEGHLNVPRDELIKTEEQIQGIRKAPESIPVYWIMWPKE